MIGLCTRYYLPNYLGYVNQYGDRCLFSDIVFASQEDALYALKNDPDFIRTLTIIDSRDKLAKIELVDVPKSRGLGIMQGKHLSFVTVANLVEESKRRAES